MHQTTGEELKKIAADLFGLGSKMKGLGKPSKLNRHLHFILTAALK